MHNDYETDVSNDIKIGRTAFFFLTKNVTFQDLGILKGLDYVTARIFTKPIELMENIITKTISSKEHRDKTTKCLSHAKNFLKHKHSSHSDKEEAKCFHILNFALLLPPINPPNVLKVSNAKEWRIGVIGEAIHYGLWIKN